LTHAKPPIGAAHLVWPRRLCWRQIWLICASMSDLAMLGRADDSAFEAQLRTAFFSKNLCGAKYGRLVRGTYGALSFCESGPVGACGWLWVR
jgi:hypothetical protein